MSLLKISIFTLQSYEKKYIIFHYCIIIAKSTVIFHIFYNKCVIISYFFVNLNIQQTLFNTA